MDNKYGKLQITNENLYFSSDDKWYAVDTDTF